ncbi:S-layer homology domain-containing protein [Gorillibacterium sp. CAU 1737]|uniref:S-layer homology domain-containing protein n=1 Tax=Gorillibacterium sp. CAU 1737 TaxID=3140362 RepID=UPI0032614461
MSKSKFLMLLLVIALLVPTQVYAKEASDFKDVDGTYWAHDAINSLVQLGVVKGFEDRTFKPAEPVTREQFAQLITLAFYLDLPSDDVQTFRDVAPSRWSFPAIEAAKDFLTGYYPPTGKAFFDPTAKASREDVAVALVKTMNYQPDDLQNSDILNRYYDGNDVSPNLQTYMAIAVEKKLMNGYEDGKLRPKNPVTRAEAAALIYRVLKGASGDSQASLELNVAAPEKTGTPTFYVTGDVTKGASVSINNQSVEVVQGQFRWAVKLEEEGTYTYTVVARMPGGKTQTVTKKVVFEKGAPSLDVKGVPDQTDKKTITVSWTVKDSNDSFPVVYLNGMKQWGTSASVELNEGDNIITVRAENSSGKMTEVVKHVLFSSGGPVLTVDSIPETTDKETVTIRWRAQDKNDSYPTVYVNEEKQYGESKTVMLKEGLNQIVVKATNSLGKTSQVIKTITFNPEKSTLTVGELPEMTEKDSVTVSWTVSDANDSYPTVYVNEKKQGYSDNTTLSLVPGPNTITVRSVNKLGKTAEVIKTITFTPSAPTLTLVHAPETTTSDTITVSWTVSDVNDSYPKIYIDDKQVSLYSDSMSVKLKEGTNTFKIVASNKYGKSTEILYTVTYTPAP